MYSAWKSLNYTFWWLILKPHTHTQIVLQNTVTRNMNQHIEKFFKTCRLKFYTFIILKRVCLIDSRLVSVVKI